MIDGKKVDDMIFRVTVSENEHSRRGDQSSVVDGGRGQFDLDSGSRFAHTGGGLSIAFSCVVYDVNDFASIDLLHNKTRSEKAKHTQRFRRSPAAAAITRSWDCSHLFSSAFSV